jgi:hypothetical protein
MILITATNLTISEFSTGLVVGLFLVIIDASLHLVGHVNKIGIRIGLLASGIQILIKNVFPGGLKGIVKLLQHLIGLILSLDACRLVEELGSILVDGALLEVTLF